jgi:uncharacterized protein YdaU (DUF1376 family)
MRYYQFHVGDYKSHTEHLSDMEDLAYRRLLDWYYLHESPLPSDTDDIARLIRMRSHSECIAVVLREFFTLTEHGWINARADAEIAKTNGKSSKASSSARVRWGKIKENSDDANAMRTHSECNATQYPIPNTQYPIQKTKSTRFARPNVDDVASYCRERGNKIDPEAFVAYYDSNGWKIGKSPMKDWKAAVRTWETRSKNNGSGQTHAQPQQAQPSWLKEFPR